MTMYLSAFEITKTLSLNLTFKDKRNALHWHKKGTRNMVHDPLYMGLSKLATGVPSINKINIRKQLCYSLPHYVSYKIQTFCINYRGYLVPNEIRGRTRIINHTRLERRGRGLFRSTVEKFACNDCEKSRKILVKTSLRPRFEPNTTRIRDWPIIVVPFLGGGGSLVSSKII